MDEKELSWENMINISTPISPALNKYTDRFMSNIRTNDSIQNGSNLYFDDMNNNNQIQNNYEPKSSQNFHNMEFSTSLRADAPSFHVSDQDFNPNISRLGGHELDETYSTAVPQQQKEYHSTDKLSYTAGPNSDNCQQYFTPTRPQYRYSNTSKSIEEEHYAQEARFQMREKHQDPFRQTSPPAINSSTPRRVSTPISSNGMSPEKLPDILNLKSFPQSAAASIPTIPTISPMQSQQLVMIPGVGLRMIDLSSLIQGALPTNYLAPNNTSYDQHSKYSSKFKDQPPAESADGFIYKIQFKRMHRYFILGHSAPRGVQIGDFVKVEADRGEDLGIVCGKIASSDFREERPTAGYRGRGSSIIQEDNKRLLRLASEEERAQLPNKLIEELKTLQVCREKVIMRSLPMEIRDAEYQFDHHKLTFYFEADRRIDFRDLVSDLFALYKTRIWMQQIDTSFVPDELAARSLLTGLTALELESNRRDPLTDEYIGSFHYFDENNQTLLESNHLYPNQLESIITPSRLGFFQEDYKNNNLNSAHTFNHHLAGSALGDRNEQDDDNTSEYSFIVNDNQKTLNHNHSKDNYLATKGSSPADSQLTVPPGFFDPKLDENIDIYEQERLATYSLNSLKDWVSNSDQDNTIEYEFFPSYNDKNVWSK